MDYETTMHLVYVGCMAVGALLFLGWSFKPRGVHIEEYLVAILIPVWSGLAYLAMALDLGKLGVAGQTTYWARYADWVVTTPLILLALSFTAMHRLPKRNWVLIGALVAADVVMILCAMIADFSPYPTRYVFYWIGVAALCVVFWFVWVPLRRIAYSQGTDLGRVYVTVAGYMTVLWVMYPTAWILGPSGVRLFGQPTDTAIFVVLPVLSKVGFSILDLSLLRRLSPTPSANQAAGREGTRLGVHATP